jgi:hypothetical protein
MRKDRRRRRGKVNRREWKRWKLDKKNRVGNVK